MTCARGRLPSLAPRVHSTAMKILTCNIRYFGAADGDNRWEKRRDLCARVITSRSPDVVCLQEAWRQQLADLEAALPDFACFGMVDEPLGANPVNAVFYRRDRLRVLSQGGFWLSETPHVTGSSSWDSACVRLANWLRLQERGTGSQFRVVNTHLDHVSQPAREGQAQVLVEDAAAYPQDYPQVLTGDLNCGAGNAAIALLEQEGWADTWAAAHGKADPGPTFHAFEGLAYRGDHGKIDWIFTRGRVRVTGAEIIDDSEGARYPSDHYFVGADLVIGPQARED